MDLELGLGNEGFATAVTPEWLFPSVNSSVCHQVCLLDKSLSTLNTDIAPLSCVDFLVHLECGLLCEGFATVDTAVRFLSCMDLLMDPEV